MISTRSETGTALHSKGDDRKLTRSLVSPKASASFRLGFVGVRGHRFNGTASGIMTRLPFDNAIRYPVSWGNVVSSYPVYDSTA